MAFEPYGGYVWSSEPAPSERTWLGTGLTLGVAAGLGLTAAAAATYNLESGRRPIDWIISGARAFGIATPFQIANTLRVPELLSPYASNVEKMQMFGPGATKQGDEFLYSFKEFIESLGPNTKNFSTYQYLKKLSGLTEQELANLGISPGAPIAAEDLIFKVKAGDTVGSLYSVVGGEHKLVAKNLMLQSFGDDHYDWASIVDKKRGVNRIAYAVMQNMNLFAEQGFNAEQVLSRTVPQGEKGPVRPTHIPVPAEAPYRPRTIAAFAMERFNRLLQGFGDQIGINIPGIKSGPASHMYLRFGGYAAGIGLGILGVRELDFFRRRFGEPAHVLASAGISGGVAWALKKAGFKPKTQFFGALASFAGQMLLPGFRQGTVEGLATTAATVSQFRAFELNPFNYYRRALEGYLPGISDWKVGALLGVGTLVAAGSLGIRNPFSGRPFGHLRSNRFGVTPFTVAGQAVRTPLGSRDQLWNLMYGELKKPAFRANVQLGSDLDNLLKELDASADPEGWSNLSFRRKVSRAYKLAGITGKEFHDHYSQMARQAEDLVQNQTNTVNEALLDKLDVLSTKYLGKTDLVSKTSFFIESVFEQFRHSLYGADIGAIGDEIAKRAPRIPWIGRGSLLFGGTLLAHQLITGGLFGSMETREELSDIYSGRELVEVGKGRWWEGGSTPWEGGKTAYYRPHAYALLMNRTRERGIWGEDDERFGPIEKFFLKNFSYYLENKNYYERPYPISGAGLESLPIIGGILSSTIGRVIKPPRLMHSDSWIREAEDKRLEYASVYEGWRREPAYNLGALGPGIPSSPFSVANQLSYLAYQSTEMAGVAGWLGQVASEKILGTQSYYPERPQLQEAGMMTSWRRQFWELELGGGFFTTEIVRRFFPNYQKEIERQNPIRNTSMPSWMPEKWHYGDPYTIIPWGEARLPGVGYASLKPELQGVDPEDYPLIYRYDILANVDPYSKEFRKTREQLYKARAAGQTIPAIDNFMDRVDKMVIDRYNIYDFQRIHENALELPGSGVTQSLLFGSEKLLRKIVAPTEYLIPFGFRPVQKLLSDRDFVERYEHERLYGSSTAFWDEPWRDWFRPSIYSALNMMGYRGKPMWRREADKTNAYFDQLEFVKWMSLAEQARLSGDVRNQITYEYAAAGTRFGVNPQGNPLGIYWTLPAEERAFFNAFALAEGKERNRILSMIPEDQTHLYQAIWGRRDQGDPLYSMGPSTPDREYLQAQYQKALAMAPMPSDDWVGWRDGVSIDDIKVKYLHEIGRDLHDFGEWEASLRKVQAQPFLEGSTQFLHDNSGFMRSMLFGDLYDRLKSPFGNQSSLTINTGYSALSSLELEYNDHRDSDIRNSLRNYLDEY